jgi:hypothetical protein
MEKADDPALPGAQVPRIVIGAVIQRLDRIHHPLPGLLPHIAFPVQHTADGFEGNARLAGYVNDRRRPLASMSAGHNLLTAMLFVRKQD